MNMNRTNVKRLLFTALLLVLVAAVLPAAAQDPVTDDEINAIARDLYCPVCENTPLDVCPTQACQDWRDEIRQQLSEGKSEAEIRAYFVERYGARVLAAPPREGFNTIVYILPILAVVIGLGLFVRYLRSLRERGDETAMVGQAAAQEPPPAADDDDYLSRMEKEVREG
jgi:cytochrome c-type biogenesis protein CcmH